MNLATNTPTWHRRVLLNHRRATLSHAVRVVSQERRIRGSSGITSRERLIFMAYNPVWWVPIVRAIVGAISYWGRHARVLHPDAIRALLHAYLINVMPAEAAQRFPLRIP